MKAFVLPDLGEGLHEAELLQWHVAVGDEVQVDQLLVSVETAKAIVDVPSPWAGRIARFGAEVGDIVKVGQMLVEIGEAEAAPEMQTREAPAASVSVVGELKHAVAQSVMEERFSVGAGRRPLSTSGQRLKPAVLAFAHRLGVAEQVSALSQNLEHGGPIDHARVVELYHSRTKPTLAPRTQVTDVDKDGYLKGARRQMALSSQQSISKVAAVTLFEDADISHWDASVDITVRCIQALVTACSVVPLLNAHFDQQNCQLKLFDQVNLGLAVDTGERLMVPVLRQAERLCHNAKACRDALDQLLEDCLNHRLKPKDFSGATLTLSNFGPLGGRYATPMIVPPQVAILGTGRLLKTPIVRSENGQDSNGQDRIVIGKLLPLSLTFDHQVATGREAAQFLAVVKQELEKQN